MSHRPGRPSRDTPGGRLTQKVLSVSSSGRKTTHKLGSVTVYEIPGLNGSAQCSTRTASLRSPFPEIALPVVMHPTEVKNFSRGLHLLNVD